MRVRIKKQTHQYKGLNKITINISYDRVIEYIIVLKFILVTIIGLKRGVILYVDEI